MAMPDYYAVLGVPRSATPADIRCSYLDLVRKLHPDRIGVSGTSRLQQVNEAYETLSDQGRRRSYDLATRPVPPAGAPVYHSPATAPRRAAGDSGRGDFLDFLPRLKPIRRGAARRPELVEFGVSLTAAEARRGIVFSLSLPVVRRCGFCRGGDPVWSCPGCGGTRRVTRPIELKVTLRPGRRDGETLEVDGTQFGAPGVVVRLHVTVR